MYLGLDPGDSGGLVALNSAGCVLDATPMPDTELGVYHWVSYWQQPLCSTYAVIELVGGFMGVGLGKKKSNLASAHTMFTFGTSYGLLVMALVANGLVQGEDWWRVAPQRWQRWSGVGRRNAKEETRPQYKARLKARALELFPGNARQVTLKTCDAFILSLYCKNLVERTL